MVSFGASVESKCLVQSVKDSPDESVAMIETRLSVHGRDRELMDMVSLRAPLGSAHVIETGDVILARVRVAASHRDEESSGIGAHERPPVTVIVAGLSNAKSIRYCPS